MSLTKERQAERHKKIAFFGVAISTVATACSVIVTPLLYYYIQTIQTTLTNEVEFCQQRSRNMWKEYEYIEQMLNIREQRSSRSRRQAYYSQENDEASTYDDLGLYSNPGLLRPQVVMYPTYCSCGIGDAGQVGLPGPPGDPGNDGLPGKNGLRGPDAVQELNYRYQEWCFDCPPALSGPPGLQGPKGLPGQRGTRGVDGPNGVAGLIGFPGELGKHGPRGSPGLRGQAGQPGKIHYVPGKKGVPGPPGLPGPVGPNGKDGNDGKDGFPGPTGFPGPQGPPGPPGRPGVPGSHGPAGKQGEINECDHCPVPRFQNGNK